MTNTHFPSRVAIQTGRGTKPAGSKGDPAKFHKVGARHLERGAHYTQEVALATALERGWIPCRICFRDETTDLARNLAIEHAKLHKVPTAELLGRLPPSDEPAGVVMRQQLVRVRSDVVIELTLRRAAHQCEMPGCTTTLFKNDDGNPYLEVHHLKLLAEDGPDHPNNTAALCPSCHRHLHYGVDRAERLRNLRAHVDSAQADFERRA